MAKEEKGQLILRGLAEARKFFEQVSLLIRTAEEMLEENGWKPDTNSNKSSDISSHLLKPDEWMPRWVSRFFKSDEHIDLLLYIGVLLDQTGGWAGFREPWVTCGLFQYLPEKIEMSEDWELEWVTAHLDQKRDPDGSFYECAYELEEQESEGILREWTMALPLIEIGNAEELKRKFIEPLLNQVNKISQENIKSKA